MTTEMSFEIGEKILARTIDSPLFYEAKIVSKNGTEGYKVHYLGWNKKHDEFISFEMLGERTKKFTQGNLKQAKAELAAAKIDKENKRGQSISSNVNGKGSQKKTGNSKSSSSISKRSSKQKRSKPIKVQIEIEKEKPEEEIPVESQLPANLNAVYVQDYQLIHCHSKLYNLPAKIPVERIVNDYLNERTRGMNDDDPVQLKCLKDKTITAGEVIEKAQALPVWFNLYLTWFYLYDPEIKQYEEAIQQHKNNADSSAQPADFDASAYYGFPHLVRTLRFFEKHMQNIDHPRYGQSVYVDFAQYLNDRVQQYFNGEDDYDHKTFE